MRISPQLLQHIAGVTLFTRQNCSLCEMAKAVIKDVSKTRRFDYKEIDVMSKGQVQWKTAYEFDTPVLHVQSVLHTYEKPDIVTAPRKLFHRFRPQEIEKLLDEVEGNFRI